MKKALMAALFCAFFGEIALAQTAGSLEVKTYKLSNGLTVWLNEDHSQPKIFGAVLVKAGAKDCPNTGIAHYFEHMMFKGTDKIGTTDYPAEKVLLDSIERKYDELAITKNDTIRKHIQKEINELSVSAANFAIPNEYNSLISKFGGTGLNAGTSNDYTVYYNKFSPQYIHQWAEINSERLINPVFRLFQSELETVYEEKNMYSDFIGSMAMEKVLERFFQPHPYAYPIVGSTESLKNPQLSQMRKFFKDYYVAGNMGLIMSGDFKTEEILPILEKTFSRVQAGNAPQKEILQPKPFVGKEKFVAKIPIPVIKVVAMGWRGVPVNHPDEVALRIVSGLLNNENGTGYLDKLSVDGKVMQAAGLTQSFNEAGILAVLVVPKILFQSTENAKSLVMKEVDRIKTGDFSEEAFNSLKLEQKRNYEKALENIDSRAQKMLSIFSEGKSWNDYLGEINKIDALTKEDIVKVANTYFTENYLEITKKTGTYPKDKLTKPDFAPIVPKNREAKSDYARSLDQMETLKANPRFIDFTKDAKSVQLAPKVMLYTTPNQVNDIFTLNLEFGKGTLESNKIEPMSSYLSLLGTDSLTFNQFREKLQGLGSTLNFEAGTDKFVIKLSGFDPNFDETLALLGHFMSNVKADQKKIKQVVDATKINRKAEVESPDNEATALLDKIRYGNQSEYLNRLTMSEVKRLKGEDLLTEFKILTKVACDMHYCGNSPSEVVAEKIKKSVAVSEMTLSSQTPLYLELKNVDAPTIYFINAPKASQSIVTGYMPGGINPDATSRFTAILFNNYFGWNMGSLIFQQIREFRSLAYRANATYRLSAYCHRDKKGQFTAMLSTQCDKTTDAFSVLDSLIKEMPVLSERVENAKQAVVNEALNDYPSFRDLSSRISYLKKQGYESDPNQALVETVGGMDIQDIVDFYTKNIKGRTMVYMVVGNRAKINMDKLATFGKIIEVKPKEIFN